MVSCPTSSSVMTILALPTRLLLLLSVFLPLLPAKCVVVLAQEQEQAPSQLLARLDYGTFQGAYDRAYNITYWQKIPFAQPPLGPLRFRGPQPLGPGSLYDGGGEEDGDASAVYNSTQPFDMCVQRTVNGSEDCLYLGIYSRPWTTTTTTATTIGSSQPQEQEQSPPSPLRPVVVVFYGGAYIQGSASFSTLPPSAYPVLDVSAATELMFVYPNYRTNAFGFLPGREVGEDQEGSDLNPGLLDQDAAIKWTKKYISHFGGDPSQIAIWGQSAGGGSVVAQVLAGARHGSRQNNNTLFTRALASSPFWPKTYDYDAPEAQAVYDTFSALVGCGPGGPGSLACLKAADVQALRDAALVVDASHTYNTSSYTWAPVIDGRFLTKRLSEIEVGEVNVEYAWAMYNTHEGENFAPPGLATKGNNNSSAASFDGWLAGFLPSFSPADLARVRALYPAAGSTETIARYNDSYTRAGLIYRDTVLACPAYWMASAAPGTSYLGEYSISPAKHASDTEWWNTVSAVQQTDPDTYHGYTGAFASFLQTGDPNALKLTGANDTGVPPLSSGKEFNIHATGFAQLDLTQFKMRCDYWKSVAAKIPI